jgi:anaerobic selenocysteine-containing dehydrogenase
MHPADAKARGISDGDTVRVHNDIGELMLPAYVTARIMPGVVVVRHGAWIRRSDKITALSPDGVDVRGAENWLTLSTDYPWTTGKVLSTNMVEVGKVEEGD